MDEKAQEYIDAVITWVDGNDPTHRIKLEKALGGKIRAHIPGAELTRFGNVNELKYCLLSILTFAPFIRKIFIVTDQQDPQVFPYVNKYFPMRVGDIKIVDHQEIFRGYEQYLPTFNSRSIEALIWRIEGLADKFIYFNDDVFLVKETQPKDFFNHERPVLRGKWIPKPIFRNIWNSFRFGFNKYLIDESDFHAKPSFHVGQWNAAEKLGFKWLYFFSSHTPHSVNKKVVENYLSQHPNLIEKQISFNFRHNDQFNCASFYYHLEIKNGNNNILKPIFSFLNPAGRRVGYIEKKLRQCEEDFSIIFMNIQSLELCEIKDQEKIIKWMEKKLKL